MTDALLYWFPAALDYGGEMQNSREKKERETANLLSFLLSPFCFDFPFKSCRGRA